MKRIGYALNILIVFVAIFFAYKVFSYKKIKTDQKKSMQIYSEIEDKALVIENGKFEEEKIDFESLKSINDEIFAWIKSDEGSIDYPIVQCRDNYKYLYTAANGEKNVAGSIFMDYRNKSIEDPLVLIYGHEMNDRTMFGSLHDFKKNPTHKNFQIITEDKKIKAKAVLASIISGETYINPKDYNNFDMRQNFFKMMKDNAVFDDGYELKEDDKIISLVTCTYEGENVRLVVILIQR